MSASFQPPDAISAILVRFLDSALTLYQHFATSAPTLDPPERQAQESQVLWAIAAKLDALIVAHGPHGFQVPTTTKITTPEL